VTVTEGVTVTFFLGEIVFAARSGNGPYNVCSGNSPYNKIADNFIDFIVVPVYIKSLKSWLLGECFLD
jgi:hypothetical protein